MILFIISLILLGVQAGLLIYLLWEWRNITSKIKDKPNDSKPWKACNNCSYKKECDMWLCSNKGEKE